MRRILAAMALGLVAGGSAAAQPFAYVANSVSGWVSVIDTSRHVVVAGVWTGGSGSNPVGVAVTPDAALVYVTHLREFGQETVKVIATSTNRIIAQIPMGPGRGVAVTPDGAIAYVTGPLSAVETSTQEVVATLPWGGRQLAVSADGGVLYATSDSLLSVIDTATHERIALVSLPEAYGVALAPGGKTAYVTHGQGVAVIDTATHTVVATIAMSSGNQGIAVTPDGTLAYVANFFGTVAVIDTATAKLVATVDVGRFTAPTGVAVTPDGRCVYVTQASGNAVAVIDTATQTMIASIPVAGGPSGIAIARF